MRIPQQPPDLEDLLDRRFQDLAGDPEKYAVFAKRAENHYWHWDKIRFTATEANLDPELAWLFVRWGRRMALQNLPLDGEFGVSCAYSVPAWMQQELMLIDQQLAGQLTAHDDNPLSKRERDLFVVSSLQEEAVMSSMLEGAATTRREAKRMLQTGRKPRNRGEQMVANNFKAITFLKDHKDTPLTADLLIEVQRMLIEGTLDDPNDAGRFRGPTDDIRVVSTYDNETIHTPPPSSELSLRVKRLCEFANGKNTGAEFIHPVLKACVLHFQIGYDHPFCDGNGRTARAVFYWMMIRSGYWMFEFMPISRLIIGSPSKYVHAFVFAETDGFDLTYFLAYKIRIIARARRDLQLYIKDKRERISEARRVFSGDSQLNSRQRDLALSVMRYPDRMVTIQDHLIRHGVAYETARRDLMDLHDRGYLSVVKVGKRLEFMAGPKLRSI